MYIEVLDGGVSVCYNQQASQASPPCLTYLEQVLRNVVGGTYALVPRPVTDLKALLKKLSMHRIVVCTEALRVSLVFDIAGTQPPQTLSLQPPNPVIYTTPQPYRLLTVSFVSFA